jgi:hypothetical protein
MDQWCTQVMRSKLEGILTWPYLSLSSRSQCRRHRETAHGRLQGHLRSSGMRESADLNRTQRVAAQEIEAVRFVHQEDRARPPLELMIDCCRGHAVGTVPFRDQQFD